MTTPAVERCRPPLTGDERTLLTAFLEFHRDTVRIRCTELSRAVAGSAGPTGPVNEPAGPPRHPPATLTMPVELVAHLRWLEYFWCEVVLAGRNDEQAPYTEQDPGNGFKVVKGTTLGEVLREYLRQCEASRQVLAGLDLDHEVEWHDRRTSVRWVFLHLIEETARHNGHLDAVRELLHSSPAAAPGGATFGDISE